MYLLFFLSHVSRELDKLLANNENFLILGGFNSVTSDKSMREFCEMYDLINLLNEATCYKNPHNPSIDVIFTNKKESFQNSMALETGLSDYHKMIITVLKRYFKRRNPIIKSYRTYKHFNEGIFRSDLIRDLKNFNMGVMAYNNFKDLFLNVRNEHAPMKKKTLRGNNAPFMNKTLSKAFMHRSPLKNNYNKNPTGANKTLYKKQRNYCVNLLCKEKRKYYNNLDLRIFEDNKTFWQRIKPLFSEKNKMLPKDIIIVENNTVTSNNTEVAEKLNNCFIEAVEKLDIEPFTCGNKDEIGSGTIEEIFLKI